MLSVVIEFHFKPLKVRRDISNLSKVALARSRLYLSRVNVRSDNVPRGLVNNFALILPYFSDVQPTANHLQPWPKIVPVKLKHVT